LRQLAQLGRGHVGEQEGFNSSFGGGRAELNIPRRLLVGAFQVRRWLQVRRLLRTRTLRYAVGWCELVFCHSFIWSGGLFYLGFESESLALKMSVAVPLMSLKRLDFELASGWQWMWDVDVTLYLQRCEWLAIMV